MSHPLFPNISTYIEELLETHEEEWKPTHGLNVSCAHRPQSLRRRQVPWFFSVENHQTTHAFLHKTCRGQNQNFQIMGEKNIILQDVCTKSKIISQHGLLLKQLWAPNSTHLHLTHCPEHWLRIGPPGIHRSLYDTNPQECTIIREIPQNYHTFALFDPPKNG